MEVRAAAPDDPRAPAADHRQRPPRPPRCPRRLGLPDPRAVHAPGMGPRRRPAGALGNLPDVFRIVGLRPRRNDLEVGPQLIVLLVETVSKGGNLLLNVGPTGRGTFDERALDRLRGIGAWMDKNGRSVYGCTQAPAELPAPRNCLLTYNPDTRRLYVHVLEWPLGVLALDGFAGRV